MGKILFFLLPYLPEILSLESLQAVAGSFFIPYLLQSTGFVFAFRIQATKKPRYEAAFRNMVPDGRVELSAGPYQGPVLPLY